jgi:hypothetical protein
MQPFNPRRPFLKDLESLGQYHDFWATVIFKAPDDFHYSFLPEPVDQSQALADAFESLQYGLRFAKAKIKDERQVGVIAELLRMSYEFYLANERKLAIRALQEAEGLIWPSQRIRLELTAVAEMRAFGAVQMFKDVRPRKFDGEASLSELGPGQRKLLDFVWPLAKEIVASGAEFKMFPYVVTSSGELLEVRLTSSKKTNAEIQRLASSGEITASIRADFFGVLIFELEERGKPLISARAKWENGKFNEFRFFLDDPRIFPLEDGNV